ncbi:MAG: hypothetical protein IJ170_10440 [Ruminococcus sp.]|nr:hypothetical protein [Ruminococcus sp.]
MNKIISGLLSVLLIAGTFTGCSDPKNETKSERESSNESFVSNQTADYTDIDEPEKTKPLNTSATTTATTTVTTTTTITSSTTTTAITEDTTNSNTVEKNNEILSNYSNFHDILVSGVHLGMTKEEFFEVVGNDGYYEIDDGAGCIYDLDIIRLFDINEQGFFHASFDTESNTLRSYAYAVDYTESEDEISSYYVHDVSEILIKLKDSYGSFHTSNRLSIICQDSYIWEDTEVGRITVDGDPYSYWSDGIPGLQIAVSGKD